ncbi:hypothetical protein ACQ4PT_057757 [Festuca glaucescens]
MRIPFPIVAEADGAGSDGSQPDPSPTVVERAEPPPRDWRSSSVTATMLAELQDSRNLPMEDQLRCRPTPGAPRNSAPKRKRNGGKSDVPGTIPRVPLPRVGVWKQVARRVSVTACPSPSAPPNSVLSTQALHPPQDADSSTFIEPILLSSDDNESKAADKRREGSYHSTPVDSAMQHESFSRRHELQEAEKGHPASPHLRRRLFSSPDNPPSPSLPTSSFAAASQAHGGNGRGDSERREIGDGCRRRGGGGEPSASSHGVRRGWAGEPCAAAARRARTGELCVAAAASSSGRRSWAGELRAAATAVVSRARAGMAAVAETRPASRAFRRTEREPTSYAWRRRQRAEREQQKSQKLVL